MRLSSIFKNISKSNLKRSLMVLAFLLIAVSIRLYFSYENIVKESATSHYLDARRIEEHLFDKLKSEIQFLKLTSAYLVASDSVSSQKFHQFYLASQRSIFLNDSISMGCIFPGSTAKNSSVSDAFLSVPQITINQSYIAFKEPIINMAHETTGYDFMTNLKCKQLLNMARDSGKLTIGAIQNLKYAAGSADQKQILLFCPVYKLGQPISSVAERRRAFEAWVYRRINLKAFMQESLEMTEDLLRLKDYQVEMFADSISSKTQLFDSHELVVSDQPAFRTGVYSVNGVDFYFKFTLLELEKSWFKALILRFGVAGFILSFLIFSLILVLYSTGDQARALAADLTMQYKRSEERLKIALQASNESVWEWNLNTNEVYFSPFGKAKLGYADDEILNDLSFWEKLIHPDDFKTANINLQNFLSSEADYFENEFRMRHKDGHYLFILSKATKQFDESSGKPFRIVGTQIDVSEISEISRKLSESEARFRLMAENMIDVVWIFSLDQNRFTYISPSVFSLRGITAEEALNENVAYRIHGPGTSTRMLESMLARVPLLKDPQNFNQHFIDEIQLPHKNGDLIWVEIISRYQYNSDGELEVLGVTRKIEERKRFEKLIMDKNDQLHDINSIKDKFFGIIAHDLRNPFLAINGMSELLLDNYKIFDQEKTIKYISSIASSSKNASQLLENLLLWAKSQSDTIQYIEEDIVLEVLLNNMATELSANLSAKDMTINIEMNNPEIIKADRFMLSFIIRNLVGNAIKFSKRNTLIKIRSYRDKDKAIVCVSDSGIGISLNDQKKLFKISDKFTVPGTENELGSGLGLLLCKEFVERNRGEIWVESEVGQGSSFYFSLPLANA